MTISVSEIPLATITGEMITQIAEDLSSSHIISGLGCSDGGGTTLAIAPGTARIGGYRAISDATVNQVLTDASVNYVYFSLTTDAQARVNGAEFVDYVTTQAENMKLIVSEVTCSGGAISTIIDQRVYKPITNVDIRDIDAATVSIGTLANAVLPSIHNAVTTFAGGNTSSTGWVTLASCTLATGNNPVLILIDGAYENATAGEIVLMSLAINGVRKYPYSSGHSATSHNPFTLSTNNLETLSAGTNTLAILWKVNAGQASCYGTRLTAIELKK